MPHHKHQRFQRNHNAREDANNNTAAGGEHPGVAANGQQQQQQQHGHGARAEGGGNDNQQNLSRCCVPTGCSVTDNELIDCTDPGSAVRVVCNNENCTEGNWMHRQCFEDWEEVVLAFLRSCGRARSWSEKQRLQNLWTKKGYDLAFKACDCKCNRGHLRKDLGYFPPPPTVDNAPVKKQKKKKKNDKPMAVVSNGKGGRETGVPHIHTHNVNAGGHSNNIAINNNGNANVTGSSNGNAPLTVNNNNVSSLRLRTDSVSSTGSSPPTSASSCSPTPLSPLNNGQIGPNVYFKHSSLPCVKPKFDFFTDPEKQATTGNMFRRRSDYSALAILPRHKQNSYHIKMEDEGPHGNDDTRSFVLSHLSSYKITSLKCVLCKCVLPVFDRYPLIDGTFFLSPQAYDDGVVQVVADGRLQFINSVCVNCLEGKSDIRCAACKRTWDGSNLVVGSMYTYDIFAAMPCCPKRLTCKHCRRAVVDVGSGLPYFSAYSHMIACPYCKAHDYHFIRPLAQTFTIREHIWG